MVKHFSASVAQQHRPSSRHPFTHPPLGNSDVGGPRLGGELLRDGAEGGVGAADVVDGGLEAGEQGLDLCALAADLVGEEGVAGLRRLQPGVEEGLVRGEGGGEVRGEDGVGGEEGRPGGWVRARVPRG